MQFIYFIPFHFDFDLQFSFEPAE